MRSVHLVLAIGADDQHVRGAAACQRREPAERRVVGPLQVVQEQHQRLALGGQGRQERLRQLAEACLLFVGRHLGDTLHLGQERAQLRNALRQQRAVGTDGLADAHPVLGQLLLGLRQQRPHAGAQRLEDGQQRHAALLPLELAERHVGTQRREARRQLAHEGRLADARGPTHEHELRRAGHQALEGRGQHQQLHVAAHQTLLERQGAADVARPQHDAVERVARRVQGTRDLLEVERHALGALVAVARVLGQQPVQQRVHRRGDTPRDGAGQRRLAGQVRMQQRERVVVLEGQAPHQELEQRGPQGVQVGPVIQVAVRSPGLLRRDVRQRAAQGREAP
jgi:hypothetical protein